MPRYLHLIKEVAREHNQLTTELTRLHHDFFLVKNRLGALNTLINTMVDELRIPTRDKYPSIYPIISNEFGDDDEEGNKAS